MKYSKGNVSIIISLLIGVTFISCSEEKLSTFENSKNKKLIDSLLIEKVERATEIEELNTELDSLKKLRDTLKKRGK